jgi:hypothetical protein
MGRRARPIYFCKRSIVFAIDNFVFGLIEVLLTPLVLSFTSVTFLGTIQSKGGAGILLGSVVMSVWGGPWTLIRGVFGFAFLSQLCILALRLPTNAALFALASFLFFFSLPFINGYRDAILLRKVAPDIQGRVFATINMICW